MKHTGIVDEIRNAFAGTERPGDWALVNSNEGDEPREIATAFATQRDWQSITPAFLNNANVSAALSFLSDEAFRYFIPAYLVADLENTLSAVDPAFSLCHGLDDDSRGEKVNPRRYGERTWLDVARHKFAVFTQREATAIVSYLRVKAAADEFDRERIEPALRYYWLARAGLHS